MEKKGDIIIKLSGESERVLEGQQKISRKGLDKSEKM